MALNSFSQTQSVTYFTQFNTIFSSGDYAPFWFTANRQGISSVSENSGYARFGLSVAKPFSNKDYKWAVAADAVAGYLAERFSGSRDRVVMMAAGDATIRIAAKEQQYRNMARAERMYTDFFVNYRTHTAAATLAAAKAMEMQRGGRYADAVKYWDIITRYYTNTPMYASSLAQLSLCKGKLGDKDAEIDYISRYIPVETVKIRKLQAQFRLAQMYQRDGLSILAEAAAAAETNAAPETVETEERRGTMQIVKAVKQFGGFTAAVDEALADPSTPKDDISKYKELKEAALFMVGECWSRMNRPEKNLQTYRAKAAESYEAYVKAYPEGKWAKVAYVKLGTIYTALNDMGKSKDALDRLSRKFPDSDEAKNAKPRLAKSLIEMGMKVNPMVREGDIVSLDMGMIYKGYHSDAARTHAVGQISPQAQQLMDVTKQSVFEGIVHLGRGGFYGSVHHQVTHSLDVAENR